MPSFFFRNHLHLLKVVYLSNQPTRFDCDFEMIACVKKSFAYVVRIKKDGWTSKGKAKINFLGAQNGTQHKWAAIIQWKTEQLLALFLTLFLH